MFINLLLTVPSPCFSVVPSRLMFVLLVIMVVCPFIYISLFNYVGFLVTNYSRTSVARTWIARLQRIKLVLVSLANKLPGCRFRIYLG